MKSDEVEESRIGALKRRLRERVGNLAAGTRLPSLRELAEQYACSLGSAQMAANQLIAEGLLIAEARRGLFVARPPPRTRNVILVLPSLRLEQMDHLIRGSRMGLDGTDLNLVIQAANDSFDGQAALLDRLMPDDCAGALVCPPTDDRYARHLQGVVDRGIPLVQATHCLAGVQVDTVAIDGYRWGALAVERLLAAGHRHFAVVGSDRASQTSRTVDDGIRAALRRGGIDPQEVPIVGLEGFALDAVQPWRSSEVWTGRVLDRQPATTAVIACNQHGGLGAVRALRARGRRVPEDVAVVTLGVDLPWFAIHDPPLTVIEQPLEEICRRAALRLTALIAGTELGVRIELVNPQIVERISG